MADQIRSFPTGFDPARFEEERADVHLIAVDDQEGPGAECSLYGGLKLHRSRTSGWV
jgi:hypothetical protein